MKYSEFVAITSLVRTAGVFTEKEFQQLLADVKNQEPIQNIMNKYSKACLEAVKKNHHIIEYIGNYIPESLYEEICLVAVEKNGRLLRYIQNQSYNICSKALENDGLALKYVKNQTIELCIIAIKNNQYAAEHVDKSIFDPE
jgi:hypothetical protein